MRNWTAEEVQAIADRLRRARIAAGFGRATEAVRKFGWNYSRYMNYENGERSIPPKQAILFASAFSVTVDYIYYGKNDIFNESENQPRVVLRTVRRIPLVSLREIEALQRIVSGLEPMAADTIPVSSDGTLPEHAIFIEVQDKSMSNPNEPISFEPGDKAMIDLDASPAPGDFVLVLVHEEKAAFFRLYREIGRTDDGSMIADLVPLNPNFRTIRISGADGIIGVCRRIDRIVELPPSRRAPPG